MNSETKKEKEKKKKLKEKKSEEKKLGTTNEVPEGNKKNSILSKLDNLDDITREESRVVEAKLQSGLIKSQQSGKGKISEEKEQRTNKIRREIADLQNLKIRYHSDGNYGKAIKIAKKIIVLAFSNNLKSIVNEENKFLEIIQNNTIQEQEELELNKEDESRGFETKELANSETEIQEKDEFDQEKRKFKEEKDKFDQERHKFKEKKEKFEQESLNLEEEKKAFKWEKEMFEEIKKHEKEKSSELKEIHKS